MPNLNFNVILGVAALVGVGILARFDWLPNQYANLAIGMLFGAGGAKAANVIGPNKEP